MIKYAYILIYCISVFFAIINYHKIKGTKSRFFLYLLIMGLITEILGYYIGFHTKLKFIYAVYNVYLFLNFIFYILFFRSFILNKKKRKIVIYILLSLITFIAINYAFIQTSFLKIQLNSFVFGTLSLIVTIILYLSDLIEKDIILNIKYVLLFWISIGSFLFYIGWLPVTVLSSFIKYNVAWHIIILFLNILMHSCFITGLVLSKKEFNN